MARSVACVELLRRKWATARSWRPLVASEIDWSVACFLHVTRHCRAARLLPSLALRLANHPAPLHLRPGSSDFATFREIFVDNEYGEVFSSAVPPSGVLDLGANVGLTARWLRGHFPLVRVMCVEPDEANAFLATRNLQSDIAMAKAFVVRAFAGGAKGEAGFVSRGCGLENEGRLSKVSRAVTVPVHTVGELIEMCPFSIDLVKIDVEGSERDIFEADLSWLAAVDHVLVEVHDPLDENWLRCILDREGSGRLHAVLHRRRGAFMAWVTCRN